MVTLLFLNGENKGELFVHRTESGDFLIRIEDLSAAGFRAPSGTVVEMEGERHLSLRSMSGVSFSFEERTLTLRLDALPSLLPKTSIELASQPEKSVYYPKESNLFVNYGAEYRAGEGVSFQSLNLTNEIGVRRGEYLLLTDTLYSNGRSEDNFVRLHTSLTRDDRPKMRRFILGDLFASSGALGSGTNLGGISISKVYGIDPFFVTYPTLELNGQASLPSEVDIYLNGTKIRTERVAPGEFQLRNLSTYGGAGVIDLVVRDSLGREQRFSNPFYATDNALLKTGLHDYSYSLGLQRDEFGRSSNRYSDAAAVVFHRYGFRDYLTLGFRGEASADLVNGGPQAALRLGTWGLLNLSLSGSAGAGASSATDISYQYLEKRFNGRLFYQYFSQGYRTLASAPLGLDKSYAGGGGLGYTHPKLGSLSLDLTAQRSYPEPAKHIAAIGYSKGLPGNVNLTATYRRVQDPALGSSNEFFLGLNYSAKHDLTFSARQETTVGGDSSSLQVQKNSPTGEGTGFRALLQRDRKEAGTSTLLVNPMLQYNGRHATVRGEISAVQSGGGWSESYQLGASGALVFLKGVSGLTRPVTDSFAVVKVGNIEGVTVRAGSQDVGKTDASGRVFVTNLSAYNDNLIAINEKDIPFEFYFPQVKKLVSPPLRSGTCISFLVTKFQPITGTLKIREGGKAKPVEFQEVALQVDGKEISFQTGPGGEFYIDISQSQQFTKLSLSEEQNCATVAGDTGSFPKPGTYRATVNYRGKRHAFTLTIPNSPDPIIDLGQVLFDPTPELDKAPAPEAVPRERPQKEKGPRSG